MAAIEQENNNRQQAEQQRAAEKTAKIMESWEPFISEIYSAIPIWAAPYLTYPLDTYPSEWNGSEGQIGYEPATLQLPECAPILVFGKYKTHNPTVRFAAQRYEFRNDEEEGPIAQPTYIRWYKYDLEQRTTVDFNIAVAQARMALEEKKQILQRIERIKQRQQEAAAAAQQAQGGERAAQQKTPLERMQSQMDRLYNAGELSGEAEMLTLTYALALAAASIATSLDKLAATVSPLFDGTLVVNTFDESRHNT